MTDNSPKPKKDRSEYNKAWQLANIERIRKESPARAKAWRKANPEKARAAQHRANHSEKGIAKKEKYRTNHPGAAHKAHRKAALKKRYKITPEQWDTMFAAQRSMCANLACRIVDPGKAGWHTDHCHTTGRLRAILCRWCNHTLGLAKDNPSVLRGLADYVERHESISNGQVCMTIPHGWKKTIRVTKTISGLSTC